MKASALLLSLVLTAPWGCTRKMLAADASNNSSNSSSNNTTTTNSSNDTANSDSSLRDAAQREAEARLSALLLDQAVSVTGTAPSSMALPSSQGFPRVAVSLAFHLASVLDVADTEQTFTVTGFVQLRWTDPALRWNASDHAGVASLVLLSSTAPLWRPRINAANSISLMDGHLLSGEQELLVLTDGTVMAWVMWKATLTCRLDHRRYPYDSQNCVILFEPASDRVALRMDGCYVFPSAEPESSEGWFASWEMLAVRPTRNPAVKGCAVQVQRKSLFYSATLVLPLVLTALLNTLVFLVPLASGEKISFLVSIFVFNSVFIAFFNDVMPRGLDSVPVIMQLAVFVASESVVVLLVTLAIMTRHAASFPEPATADVNPGADVNSVADVNPGYNPRAGEAEEKRGKVPRSSVRSAEGSETWCSRIDPLSLPDRKGQGKSSSKSVGCSFVFTPKMADRFCFVLFTLINGITLSVLFLALLDSS